MLLISSDVGPSIAMYKVSISEGFIELSNRSTPSSREKAMTKHETLDISTFVFLSLLGYLIKVNNRLVGIYQCQQ